MGLYCWSEEMVGKKITLEMGFHEAAESRLRDVGMEYLCQVISVLVTVQYTLTLRKGPKPYGQ